MSSRGVKVKLDSKSIVKLMQHSVIKDLTMEYALKKTSGRDDVHCTSYIGFDRAHTIIYPNRKEEHDE